MSLIKENRKRTVRSLNRNCSLGIAVAILLFAGSAVRSSAQHAIVTTPPKAKPAAPRDPLGRETPRGAVIGFLKYALRKDYETVARYLQQPPGQHINLSQLPREMDVLRARVRTNVGLLSDDPNGTVEAGLPPDEERAGIFQVGGKNTDIILVRVDDPTYGKIWLISQQTVANLPKLTAEVESETPTRADRIRLAVLSGPQLLGMSTSQWLGWLISIPISWLLAWLLGTVLGTPKQVWCKLRKRPFRTVWITPAGIPLKCMVAILLHSFFVYELHPPLVYRVYYFRFMEALLAVCFAWLASEIADQGFDRAVNRIRVRHADGESILILTRRLSRIAIFIIAVIGALSLLGLNVSTALAGLGIGGLAVALGAQKSLENLIGGVSLLMDKAVQSGDFCKIGDQLGTVEDIGLRSLKLRTLDQNLLVVPNGMLAQMQFENMKSRPKLLIHQNFSLRIETSIEQLQFVLNTAQTMLHEHPTIESGTSRLRVTNFAGAAFELELFAYGETGDWSELTNIRQDVLLKIVEIVKAAGTGFAAPTRLIYQSAAAVIDHPASQPAMPDESPVTSVMET